MIRLSVAALAITLSPIAAGAACLTYEGPQTVEGVISHQTFPGAPNFESIANGDAKEQVSIVKLAKPLCVDADPTGDPINEAVASFDSVHVVPATSIDRKLVGRTVKATGIIYHSHTGHHHAPIVMEDARIQLAR